MRKKFTLMILIVIVAFVGLSTIYAVSDVEQSNQTTLTIQAENPVAVGEMVNTIKTTPFFKNYNSDTANWLKEFNSDYVVFSSKDYYVVMNSTDSNKLPKTITTGVSVKCNISCNVLENRSLGNGLNNILVVEDVEVISGDLDNFKFGQ